MLSLLTLNQATLHILHWSQGKVSDPYAPDAMRNVVDSEELSKEYLRIQMFLSNAIDAAELPALKKAKPFFPVLLV